MACVKPYGISDDFWALVEPLIPTDPRETGREYIRKPGGGRKPKYSNRLYFSAIVYVLRTGIIWNALPRMKFEGVSSSIVHRKFQRWEKAGVFRSIWQQGLAEYEALEGIAWYWESADRSSNFEAPVALKSIGPGPMDLDKNMTKWKSAGGREWRPLVTHRERSQSA